MIGVVHVDAWMTVPFAIVIAAGLLWYWIRLGADGVPLARRRVRRMSVFIMALSLPHFVRGLSYLDPVVNQLEYVVAWSVGLLAILFVFLTACLDALLTVRMLRRDVQSAAGRAIDEILSSRRGAAGDGDRSS